MPVLLRPLPVMPPRRDARAAKGKPGVCGRLADQPWPLLVPLTVQAVLSWSLTWTNTAFQDEALYLWAGHLEWAHWLHGKSIPNYPSYFSGAPVLYPPLGALADSAGGLAGARLLSLGFMLIASALLWGTASRLYGRRAAFFATCLWAMLGPTIHLGALATYDAMSLCLMALAAWCAVRAGARGDEVKWLAWAAVALVLSNATKYASAIFDPVVIVLVIFNARCQAIGLKESIARGAALTAYVTAGDILLVMLGGGYYESGIGQTTLTRALGNNPPSTVLHYAWSWTAPVVVIALAGVLAGSITERARSRRLLLASLLAAAALAPLEQARIHTITSLDKHVDFGAWFAVVAAGYAADKLITCPRTRRLRILAAGTCVAALVPGFQRGAAQSRALTGWPDAASFTATFAHLAAAHPGRFLVETPSIPEYYLPSGSQWYRWSSTRSIELPDRHAISAPVGGSGNPAVYARYIRRDYFTLVALNYLATRSLDLAVTADLLDNARYRLTAKVRYGAAEYSIWARSAPRTGPAPAPLLGKKCVAPGMLCVRARGRPRHKRHAHRQIFPVGRPVAPGLLAP